MGLALACREVTYFKNILLKFHYKSYLYVTSIISYFLRIYILSHIFFSPKSIFVFIFIIFESYWLGQSHWGVLCLCFQDSHVRNSVNKFYTHETYFILYMKLLSSLSSFKLCNVSLFNVHETFIETDLSHYHC